MEKIRFFQFNTICEVAIYDARQDAQDLLATAREEAAAVRRLLDFYDDNSQLGRLNTSARKNIPFPVSRELFLVLRKMLDFAQLSDGCFDPTIAALVRLWNITAESPRMPDKEAVAFAKRRCGWESVLLREEDHSITFCRDGMAIDAGGAGKGYAVDRVANLLRHNGVRCASIDFGGNLYLLGQREGFPWHVGVQAPGLSRGESLGTLHLSDCAVSTSGGYERFFIQNGQVCHHLLNPATGQPENNGLESITIIGKSAMEADMLSTACFVAGKRQGKAIAGKLPHTWWLAIEKQNRITLCPELRPVFERTQNNKRGM